MQKNMILDTCIVLKYPNIREIYPDYNIIVTRNTLRDLDELKELNDWRGYGAKFFIRFLSENPPISIDISELATTVEDKKEPIILVETEEKLTDKSLIEVLDLIPHSLIVTLDTYLQKNVEEDKYIFGGMCINTSDKGVLFYSDTISMKD